MKCSIQDPNSENENHRVHKPKDRCCVQPDTYLCALCGKDFGNKSELSQHLQSPHGNLERMNSFGANFECPTCEDKFKTPSDLQSHIEQLHEQSWSSFTLLSNADSKIGKYVACKVCSKMFENEADVYLHMERVHEYGEECAMYPCEECGYRGQDMIALNQHIQEYHTSKCQLNNNKI